jgi:hypothetical protein
MSDEIVEGKVEIVRLGAIEATSPNDVVIRATGMAKTLADIITSRRLYTTINGKKYVQVEGWSTLGAMMGVLPREVEVYERENGDFEATVELIRTSDCAVVGRASSIVSSDEKLWKGRERYARRSMAVTRATGKAYRLGFSWIMSLAGYEPTPAEEMPVEEVRPVKRAALPQPEQSDPVTDLLVEKFATDKDPMTIERAMKITNSEGVMYGDIPNDKLQAMVLGINKGLRNGVDDAKRAEYLEKKEAIGVILKARANKEI